MKREMTASGKFTLGLGLLLTAAMGLGAPHALNATHRQRDASPLTVTLWALDISRSSSTWLLASVVMIIIAIAARPAAAFGPPGGAC